MRFLIIVLLVAETICVGAQITGKFFHLYYYKSRGKAIMLYACNHSNCGATNESCSVLAVKPYINMLSSSVYHIYGGKF